MQGLTGFLLGLIIVLKSGLVNADVPHWVTYDRSKKQVSFKLVAAENANNNGLNYNGYYQGNLTLKVPVDWQVNITLTNRDANATHDVIVTKPFEIENIPDELTGESSTIRRAYVSPLFSNETESLKFTAKIGKYWLFCGVKGHGMDGMWIKLVVDATIPTPMIEEDNTL